ncbi:phage tail protein I [Endozoicomonas sp. SM1973]|uniref:Phage tail protein I n=1 Tax=Spartinivicinus marinus TaxID=2994442 RepID=A0A853IAZ5_9GAMM|nr:phage tail protein I [Spartinivicinus marinus]MCX4025044.1 phage tail protein I [Spartinivicinus marinus]NYZ69002.1 phage tail protein I [Spartinivicinus marinus]
MNKSLLPPNANPQEKALSEATARAGEAPVTFQTLWQADHCPLPLLPWLAWTLSVDEWDEHWDEQTKRQVIKNSIKVHQHKGTIGAVKKALDALHVRTEIKEWFEMGGEPYTFRVTAYANDNLNTPGIILNKALINQIRTTIESTKNTRSHFDFRLGAKFNTGIAAVCTARNLTIFRASCAPVIEQPVTAGIGTAAVVRPVTIIRV